MKIYRPGLAPIFTDEDAHDATPTPVAEAIQPELSIEEAMKAARERAGLPATELIANDPPRPLLDAPTRTLLGGIVVDHEGKTVQNPVPTGTEPASEPPATANTDVPPAPVVGAKDPQPVAGTLDLEAMRVAAAAAQAKAAADADLLK